MLCIVEGDPDMTKESLISPSSNPWGRRSAEDASRLLIAEFGEAVKLQAPLAPLTSARIGGPADILITATTAERLAEVIALLWRDGITYCLLGGGANVLIGDKGIRGVVVLNRARNLRFDTGPSPSVWTESGVVFSNLANRCAARGLSGLEWAASVPGTIGGAVYGNAGAFGGDMATSLKVAELVTPSGRETRSPEGLGYAYRSSALKRGEVRAVVLAAELQLQQSTEERVRSRMAEFTERRKTTQPPGASMGSMFKNPPGDKAGRLIEQAGLKGARVGTVEISSIHANFFVNHGEARADDVRKLIDLVQTTVQGQLGVSLELEIELVGEFS
ncbi:MAG: UDP-N-acetylmuramate dehydrogenase [Anaerolineales bacterium]